jgi:arylsulfatase A-like enzyme
MLMFDSLNRHMLPPYGCDWTVAPNFARLAEKTVVFDRSYVASMPCMPARRELHTGRYNLLHRSWGPIEPFDDSMPAILHNAGIQAHLASDHYHYWEDGGSTYHGRYSTFEFFRGQEGDWWKGQVADPVIPPEVSGRNNRNFRQDWINRQFMKRTEDQPQAKTFAAGMDYIRRNARDDRWFLHLETFDPHEPFFTQEEFKKLYPHEYKGKHFDWPAYGPVKESPEEVRHVRYEYAALLSMCDHFLGRLLDLMDELDLWKDTMLIVNTDHGFMLGEHDSWAKCWQPWYQELANTPLFIWDPRCGIAGERRQSLVQTIDLAPTVLEYFGQPLPGDMQGTPLRRTIADDTPVREAGLFGIFGGHVNCTDGRYVYMRAPERADNAPLFNYTLMPTHMRGPFTLAELRQATLADPFSFTKGCRLVRTPMENTWGVRSKFTTALYDLQADPQQQRPLQDAAIEKKMIGHLVGLMRWNDAPVEQYERLGLKRP